MKLKFLPSSKNSLIQSDDDRMFYDMLIKLYADNPTKCAVRIMSKHKTQFFDLRKWVFAKTARLKDTKLFVYKLLHRFIWIFQGLSDFPKCPTCGRKIGYKGIHFDSSWELALWIFYSDRGSKIRREPVVFEFEFNGKTHRCAPDFEIDGQLVEVKGDMFFENSDPTKKMIYPFRRKNMTKKKYNELNELAEAKHQFMLSHGVVYLTSKDIKEMKQYVQERYGRNYLKSFKVASCQRIEKFTES